MDIKLVSKGGSLYYPPEVKDGFGDPGPIVLLVYPEGDCDTIRWPRPNMKNLRNALLDDLETGLLNDGDMVFLPNGVEVLSF